jgi:hypothetical protein
MSGRKDPSNRMKIYIEKATEGKVKPENISGPMNYPKELKE